MKRWAPLIIVIVFAGWLAGSLRTPPDKSLAFTKFGALPVMSNGRIQPIDSLARNTLLQLREKQTANMEPWKEWYEFPKIISASEWIAGVMMDPELADNWPVFRIDHSDLKGLLGLPQEPDKAKHQDGKHYSWAEIRPKFDDLQREAERASKIERSQQRPYDQAVLRLWEVQGIYNHLKSSLGPAAGGDLENAIRPYLAKLEVGRTAYEARGNGEAFNEADLDWLSDQFNAPLVIPPADSRSQDWLPVLSAIAHSPRELDPALLAFNKMSRAYRAANAGDFNAAVSDYRVQLQNGFSGPLKKAGQELFFNQFEPFYKAMVVYFAAFLLVLACWFSPPGESWALRAAVWLTMLGLLVHTSGLIFRMFLQGRPPVTNLYSSAVFIGWGATILGLVLERFWRNSIGVTVSSIIGFLTLIIAHHLSLGGDTMQMMEAVLDTNFWLATHVVVVTLGYASTFVAGCLAIIFIVRGVFTRHLTADMSRSLARMIYGIICFASLFSFVGTVLGGIWADQSWGRFWGWDPKENGAVIIVLWNVLILHARWGGMVKERGLANLAIVGNIVTSWSWFGVNMLGIGLHSYGFTAAAFKWLMAFVASQVFLLVLGLMPKRTWLSFRNPQPAPAVRPGGKPVSSPA